MTFSVFLGACSSQDEGVPAACREGEAALRQALARAPSPVRLGATSLSECFTDRLEGGDLMTIGSAYVGVAGDLAARARRRPESDAALQLGYLAGATERAAEGSQGITYELGRRIDQELIGVDRTSTAYRRGLRAGRRSG